MDVYTPTTTSTTTGRLDISLLLNKYLRNYFISLQGVSSSNTDYDPTLGPWNTVQCRADTVLTLPTGEQNAHGMIIAFDIYPIPPNGLQILFAFQNSANLNAVLTVQLVSRQIRVGHFRDTSSVWDLIIETTNTLTTSKQILLSLCFKLLIKL